MPPLLSGGLKAPAYPCLTAVLLIPSATGAAATPAPSRAARGRSDAGHSGIMCCPFIHFPPNPFGFSPTKFFFRQAHQRRSLFYRGRQVCWRQQRYLPQPRGRRCWDGPLFCPRRSFRKAHAANNSFIPAAASQNCKRCLMDGIQCFIREKNTVGS